MNNIYKCWRKNKTKQNKLLEAPGTQSRHILEGSQNCSKKPTLSEFQFFQVCPEGSQNHGQNGMAEISRKSLLLFWLEEPAEKAQGNCTTRE